MEKTGKNGKNGYTRECKICDFKCNKTCNWNRHLLTAKHKKNESSTIVNTCQQTSNEKTGNETIEPKFPCKNCSKAYNERSGLWRHSQKCKPMEIVSKNAVSVTQEPTKMNLTEETVVELLKQNNEFKNMLVKIINKEILHFS
jgi:hypothetical protein